MAGAMALKCKIWQFAASPLFNDNQGYAGGASEAEQQHLVWYGGYRQELWDNCLKACEDFMRELQARGFYELNQSVNTTPAGYRYAYRMGYLYQGSKEVLHSVRVQMGDAFNSSTYFGIVGVIWGVILIPLHKNTWKCSRGLMENLLTGRKQKLLENWMKCL